VELLLRHDVFASFYELLVSRLDLHGDIQGWVPVLEDLHRFVGYGHNRRGFEEHNEAFTTGDRLTGLMFGRDALVARLYDKSQEIRQRGVSWLPDLWGVDGRSEPVWRLEFQFRRKVLIEFHIRSCVFRGHVGLASGSLALRSGRLAVPAHHHCQSTAHAMASRPPVAGNPSDRGCAFKHRRRAPPSGAGHVAADHAGRWGLRHVLAALRDRPELEDALLELQSQLERYMANKERSFRAEVSRKRARRLGVTAFLDDAKEEAA
jgi:hypothetical protein